MRDRQGHACVHTRVNTHTGHTCEHARTRRRPCDERDRGWRDAWGTRGWKRREGPSPGAFRGNVAPWHRDLDSSWQRAHSCRLEAPAYDPLSGQPQDTASGQGRSPGAPLRAVAQSARRGLGPREGASFTSGDTLWAHLGRQAAGLPSPSSPVTPRSKSLRAIVGSLASVQRTPLRH